MDTGIEKYGVRKLNPPPLHYYKKMCAARNKLHFTVDSVFKHKLLYWANKHQRVCILDSNAEVGSRKPEAVTKNKEQNPKSQILNLKSYDLIAGVESIEEIIPEKNCFESLKKFIDKENDWLFGFLSYDLKNEVENISSKNPDGISFPLMHFFKPKYVFILTGKSVEVQYINELSTKKEIETIIEEIKNTNIQNPKPKTQNIFSIKSRINKNEYIASVQKLQHHIQQGDIYEINFCREFYAEDVEIEPAIVFEKLNEISSAPFSAFYRLDDKYLMCASPERFIKKEGAKIISQPIKGTRKRGKTEEEDELLKHELQNDEKEKSENVMIVDLVRNDLSRSAKRGSVKVEELFGIYTFKQVHQLISSISCEIKEGLHPVDLIKNAFPMGSMTGAPKVRAMQLIEKYESMRRGLYSGALGYFSPNGDFDFNVVIRSILYNGGAGYLSFCTGGAITAKASAESEYEESLVKAKAMFEVLEN